MKNNNGKRPPKKGSAKIREILENQPDSSTPETIRNLISKLRDKDKYQETDFDDEDFFVNSMQLFSDIEAQINFEDDVGKLKDLSLYWINLILSICPDEAATAIAKRAMKEGSIGP
jgi:hypothetical protein